jgi:hypothetical protein
MGVIKYHIYKDKILRKIGQAPVPVCCHRTQSEPFAISIRRKRPAADLEAGGQYDRAAAGIQRLIPDIRRQAAKAEETMAPEADPAAEGIGEMAGHLRGSLGVRQSRT